LLRVRGELEVAQRLARNDAAIEELFGVLYSERRSSVDFQEIAATHFTQALALRSSSPYTWSNLAEVRYRLGQTGGDFERILVGAEALGPNEPQVQRVVADLGLALWPELSASTQAAVTRAVASGMQRNPLEMLQISTRRGRLDIACPHLSAGARFPDPLWAKLCEKTT
jgi:Flp pilus assembly protein TadD